MRSRFALALVSALVLSVGAATPAFAEPRVSNAERTPEQLCVDAATDRSLDVWTCMGGTLSYFGESESGDVTTVNETVAPNEVISTSSTRNSVAPMAAFDGDDTWCEGGSTVCTSITNNYAGKAKGNVVWGNSNGVNGSFDLVLRTNLNGRQSQAQAKIFRDSGADLRFTNLSIECSHAGNAFGCGSSFADREDGLVNVTTSWSGPIVFGNRLNQSGTYNDKLTGRVTPTGAPVLPLPTLSGPQFKCPSGSGRCAFP